MICSSLNRLLRMCGSLPPKRLSHIYRSLNRGARQKYRAPFTVDSKNPRDPERTREGELLGGRAFVTA